MPRKKAILSKDGVLTAEDAVQLAPFAVKESWVHYSGGRSKGLIKLDAMACILRGEAVSTDGTINAEALQGINPDGSLGTDAVQCLLTKQVQQSGTMSDFMQYLSRELQQKDFKVVSPRITPTTPRNQVPKGLSTWLKAINAQPGGSWCLHFILLVSSSVHGLSHVTHASVYVHAYVDMYVHAHVDKAHGHLLMYITRCMRYNCTP